MQASVVALAAHLTARRDLGVSPSDTSWPCYKKLLVQTSIFHGTMGILQDNCERILDDIFAPFLVSHQCVYLPCSHLALAPPHYPMILVSAHTQSQDALRDRAACLPYQDDDLYCTAFELWQKVSAPVASDHSDMSPLTWAYRS